MLTPFFFLQYGEQLLTIDYIPLRRFCMVLFSKCKFLVRSSCLPACSSAAVSPTFLMFLQDYGASAHIATSPPKIKLLYGYTKAPTTATNSNSRLEFHRRPVSIARLGHIFHAKSASYLAHLECIFSSSSNLNYFSLSASNSQLTTHHHVPRPPCRHPYCHSP